MMQVGAKNLITDVKGILVGNAHDEVVKTGVSVVSGPSAFTASYCVMGGAPGTRETDLLAPDKTVAEVDALVLSGGPLWGGCSHWHSRSITKRGTRICCCWLFNPAGTCRHLV